MSSIFVRITGNALLVAAILIVWWLLAAATSPGYFEFVDALISSWFGKLVFLGSIWALWFHLLGGVRHLIWDQAKGLELETAEKLGWAVVIGSFVLTALTLVIV